jgi:prepilin-type N-terminal cleavage/methylation domain-containing protein
MKLLRSQAGFTITEIIVVIALSGFLMAVAATGFSTFFAKFNELNKITELQRDAFNCVQKIKNGIPIGTGSAMKFSGVATADSVRFVGINSIPPTSQNIILYPPKTSVEHAGDFVRIYYDGTYVRATYLNGTMQPAAPLYLFPTPGRNNVTKVTNLRFTQANDSRESTKVISVLLEASYETKMTISMK